jgi:COP9 signalosome complex subunit 6
LIHFYKRFAGSSIIMDVEMKDVTAPESEPEKIIADSGVTATVSVSLHPLVIMNISEHWTRVRAQQGKPQNVYGALIGKQEGRNIEVMNSYELETAVVEGKVMIVREYYDHKEEQFKQVFADMDFLGWYSTGEKPEAHDLFVHKQIMEINESPLFLQMSPGERNLTELPVYLYESVIDMIEGQARILFVKLPYTLATEEAERIGLDHVARIVGGESSSSKTADQLTAQHSAIKMLAGRVRLILQYVQAVEKGELPQNHEILRQIKSMSHRLPVLQSDRFNPDFLTQCNDVALMTLLGTVMKSANNLNQFVNKFSVSYQRQGGRRMRGLFL